MRGHGAAILGRRPARFSAAATKRGACRQGAALPATGRHARATERLSVRRANATIRSIASAHSSRSATSAMRMRPRPGIDAVRVAREEAARQHRDGLLGEQPARELGIVDRACAPTGRTPRRASAQGSTAASRGCSAANLAAYSARLARTCASSFHAARLAAATAGDIARAVIGAIEQERLDQRRIAGDVARAQAGRVRALRQAAEDDEARKAGRDRAPAPRRARRAAASPRRNRSPNSTRRTAMTKPWRSDSANSARQLVEVEHAAGRIVGRADVEQLRARPHVVGHLVPVDARSRRRAIGVDAIRQRAGEQRRAFVDLVERIGHRRPSRRRGSRRRPSARRRTAPRGCRAPAAPASPESSAAARGGARATRRSPRAARARRSSWDNSRAPRRPRASASSTSCGVGCRGSPIDRLIGARAAVGVDAREQRAQPLERIRLQESEAGIHVTRARDEANAIIRDERRGLLRTPAIARPARRRRHSRRCVALGAARARCIALLGLAAGSGRRAVHVPPRGTRRSGRGVAGVGPVRRPAAGCSRARAPATPRRRSWRRHATARRVRRARRHAATRCFRMRDAARDSSPRAGDRARR